jgi:hypothetical protein
VNYNLIRLGKSVEINEENTFAQLTWRVGVGHRTPLEG